MNTILIDSVFQILYAGIVPKILWKVMYVRRLDLTRSILSLVMVMTLLLSISLPASAATVPAQEQGGSTGKLYCDLFPTACPPFVIESSGDAWQDAQVIMFGSGAVSDMQPGDTATVTVISTEGAEVRCLVCDLAVQAWNALFGDD